MPTDLTFTDACAALKDTGDPKLIDAADKLLSLALILSPLALGKLPPGAITPLSLLTAKSELVKLGKAVFDWFKKTNLDPVEVQRRIVAAHTIICFGAFFESVNAELPTLRDSLNLSPDNKFEMSAAAIALLEAPAADNPAAHGRYLEANPAEAPIALPHPTEGFGPHAGKLLGLYVELTKSLLRSFQCLAGWDKMGADDREKLISQLDGLPNKALARFRAQYIQLAKRDPAFLIWANFEEHRTTRAALQSSTQFAQRLLKHHSEIVDIGFARLTETIALLPQQIQTQAVHKAIRLLRNKYHAAIEAPVLVDRPAPTPQALAEPQLVFPRKREAFIPQSYRALRYQGTERLEEKKMWDAIPLEQDVGAFFLKYLSSPYSEHTPLIVIGHPGSGKSLLSQILIARLCEAYTCLRVELRNIKADAPINSQLEEQIKNDTGHLVSWGAVADESSLPLFIIFDGYDELLQASGRVHSGYLQTVQKFQGDELSLRHRGVRAVVTSRITLIDKATIPVGATILRLEEFDDDRQSKWIDVWNLANHRYFQSADVKPLALPSGTSNVKDLARQPLLLLMLAIYDSESNALASEKSLERTTLYDNLLRRFIVRELSKSEPYMSMKQPELEPFVDQEMRRLGVAALGMFNRRKLHLYSSEVNADLKFFGLEKEVPSHSQDRALSQADLLLGSFFFVLQTQALGQKEDPRHQAVDSAFEFLHNTFGEFLTADFIVDQVLYEAGSLAALGRDRSLQREKDRKLNEQNGLGKNWYAALIYTALCSRPVVMDMIREWLPKRLTKRGLASPSWFDEFRAIYHSQIGRILSSVFAPDLLGKDAASNFPLLPVIGFYAIYGLNLTLLAAALCTDQFTFEESRFTLYEDGTRPWDRLTYLWRSWFSIENLGAVSAVLSSVRDRQQPLVALRWKSSPVSSSVDDRLSALHSIGRSLADNTLAGLSAFVVGSGESGRRGWLKVREALELLDGEGISLEIHDLAERLRQARSGTLSHDSTRRLLSRAFEVIRDVSRNSRVAYSPILKESLRLADAIGEYDFISAVADSLVAHGGELVLEDDDLLSVIQHLNSDAIEFVIERWSARSRKDIPVQVAIRITELLIGRGRLTLAKELYERRIRDVSSLALMDGVRVAEMTRVFDDKATRRRLYLSLFESVTARDIEQRPLIESLRLAVEFGDREVAIKRYRWLSSGRRFRTTLDVADIDLILLALELGDLEEAKEMWRGIQQMGVALHLDRLSKVIQAANAIGDRSTLSELATLFTKLGGPRRLA